DINLQMIYSSFENVIQSYKKVPDNQIQEQQKFQISVIVAKLPHGGHKKRTQDNYTDYQKMCLDRKSIKIIYNDDQNDHYC
ncbi:hypothetical protein OE165_28295, partial [Escherichia coli]|uniref:hypothetical protein n=1 Tax=Escherichia coli TaxID=562 RepID=UPI0021F26847